MFRSVALPEGIPGQLYLHSMPGRYESFEDAREEMTQREVTRVICLAPLEEVHRKSPDYAHVIEASDVPWVHKMFPVPDFGVPTSQAAFLNLGRSVAEHLREGERVLIHCGAGIGRTGTLAVSVLMALGMNKEDACKAIEQAGSGPETSDQRDLVQWVADQLGV